MAVNEERSPSEEASEPAKTVEEERDEYLELAQRTRAELENFRKRAARDAALARERGRGELVRELLPAIDNLERALAAAEENGDGLLDGVQLVHRELVSALERGGVQGFDPTGEPFDPTVHEALSTQPGGEGVEPGTVIGLAARGYRLGDTVIRPAKVVVSA